MMFLCSSRVELGLLTKEFRDNLGLAPEDCTVYKTKAAAWEDTSHRPCISGIKYHGTCQCKKNRYQLTWQEGSLRKLHHFSNWHQRKGNALAKLGHFQVLVLPWCSLSLSLFYLFSHLVSSSSRPRCLLENTLGGANFRIKEAGAWPLVCICFATLPFCRRRTIFRYGPRDLFLEVSTAKELDATSKI